jgi:hypothetical protein
MKKTILTLMFIILLCSSAYALVNDSLVYYSFDQTNVSGTTMYNLANPGTLDGTCTGFASGCQTNIGKIINGSDFSGNSDYISYGVINPADTDFSFSIWFRSNTNYGAGDYGSIVTNRVGTSEYFILRQEPDERLLFTADDGSNPNALFYPSGAINDNQWHHVVITRKASTNTFKMYVDGVLNGTDTNMDSSLDLTNAGTIGYDTQDATWDWKDDLDEFGWWSRTLNVTEVQELYNSGTGYNPYGATPAGPNVSVSNVVLSPSDPWDYENITCSYDITNNVSVDMSEINWYINNVYENFTEPCLQIAHNISSECGGLDTGSEREILIGLGGYFRNYTIPKQNKGAFWELDGNNYSFPDACLNETYLQTKYQSFFGAPGGTTYHCHNGTGWFELADIPSYYLGGEIYWNITPKTLNSSYIDGGDSVICEVFAQDNTTTGNTLNSTSINVTKYIMEDPTYTNPIIETETSNIIMIVNVSDNVASLNATLYYNGTQYTPTITEYARYYLLNTTVVAPDLGASANISLIHELTFTYDNSSNETTNSTEFFQYIYSIGIDNCSVYTIKGINFTLYDEDTLSKIVGSMAGYFEVWLESMDALVAFNLTWDGNSSDYSICISPDYANYSIYAQMEYGAEGYTTETYYFEDATINNVSEQVNLYLSNDTSLVTFTVEDQDYDPVAGAFISILKYDLTTDSYVTTEIIKTDTNGEAIGNIILNSQWYKFIVTYDGVIELETEPTKLSLTEYTLRISLADSYLDTYIVKEGITSSLTYNNVTQNFVYTFSDPSGTTTQACLKVTQARLTSDVLIETSCVTSSSGTILIGITDLNGTYIATGTVTIDDNSFVTDSLTIVFDTNYKTWGLSGVFASFLIVLTLIMVGIWNPMVAVLLGTIGVLVSVSLGLLGLTMTTVVTIIILGGIAMYRLNHK